MEAALIRYKTRRGGSGMGYIPISEIENYIKKQFKQRLKTIIEFDGYIIGEVCKNPDGKWIWYLESEYCLKT